MPRYLLQCNVGMDTYIKEVTAKNLTEAQEMAASFGYSKSRQGNRFLRGYSAKRIYDNKITAPRKRNG